MNYLDISSLKYELAEQTHHRSELLIAELMALLEAGVVLKFGFSGGKDSMTVLNSGVEAMRRCIVLGKIEPERPLIAITVDTLLEPYNISMFVPYAHKKIRQYCNNLGINLYLEICTPPVYQQLMVLFAGAQKIFPTSQSGRTADCSIVWKLDSARRCLETIKGKLEPKYQNAKWVNISGSRTDESARRKNNMAKMGTDRLKSQNVLDRFALESPGYSITNFAPIADWSTREVLEYLNHAGKTGRGTCSEHYIPAVMDSFGLLLAIYGEGSNDVCSISDASEGSCNGTARYGCQTCGMVSEDHSGLEVMQYARWKRFGDDVLRFRDYLVRVSTDVRFRAHHPRAVCGVTSNVYLQPNVLKAQILENLVYFAAQITQKHQRIHEEFCLLMAEGKRNSDVGVIDILNDPALVGDVKSQYLEAYVDRMSSKPMLSLFTEDHAVLLSALWSMHGVKSAPYRPMKILDNVRNGFIKPMPRLNSELNALRGSVGLSDWNAAESISTEIPDAMVYQLFEPAKKFESNTHTMKDCLGQLPLNLKEYSAARTPVMTCNSLGQWVNRNSMSAHHSLRLKVTYTFDGQETLRVKQAKQNVRFHIQEGTEAYAQLLELARHKRDEIIEQLIQRQDLSHAEALAIILANNGELSFEFLTEIPFCREFQSQYPALRTTPTKRKSTGVRFTSRQRKKVGPGKWEAKRTSLRDYIPSTIPSLVEQYEQEIRYWVPDQDQQRTQLFNLYDYDLNHESVIQMEGSISIDVEMFKRYLNTGWKKAILVHDQYVRTGFITRAGARRYDGTSVFHELMNHSGLIMSPNFEVHVQQSLARTELFHSSQLYNIADFSRDKISLLPNVIEMNAHRAQKADQLLWVRRARNILRSEMSLKRKVALNTRVAELIANRLSEFFTIFEQQLMGEAIYGSYEALSGKTKIAGQIQALWVQEYLPIAANFQRLLKLLTSKDELQVIERDRLSLKSLTEQYVHLTQESVEHVKGQLELICTGLELAMSTVKAEDFIDDGMGNFELIDEAAITPYATALYECKVGRNQYLLSQGLAKRLAYLTGLVGTEQQKQAVQGALYAAMKHLRQAIAKWEQEVISLQPERIYRDSLQFECILSSVTPLSDQKKAELAALRAS